MNVVHISENNFDDEYKASADAIRDFLYMFFEIAGDCRPVGDFDRAELGTVDPFRYLDIEYDYEYQFRSDSEISFLHQAAAVNLLCRLAQAYETDECSGSTFVSDFNNEMTREAKEPFLREHVPDLFRIHQAFRDGRIVNTPSIHNAFNSAFSDSERFYPSLGVVLDDVVLATFESLCP